MRQIAIDGPAGSGKSTVAKILAKNLNLLYVNTGSMFRAYALYIIQKELDYQNMDILKKMLSYVNVVLEGDKVFLNQVNVASLICSPKVAALTSEIATIPEVRAKCLFDQQQIASNQDVIMDGRDIGTVVLPQADLKIFLIASPEVRAQRRLEELQEGNDNQEYQFKKILEEIKTRDLNDSNRLIAPLKQADDAIALDTSNLSVTEVVQAIEKLYNNKITK